MSGVGGGAMALTPSARWLLNYRKFKNPETMALAFSESGHNLKEARLWQECGYASVPLRR